MGTKTREHDRLFISDQRCEDTASFSQDKYRFPRFFTASRRSRATVFHLVLERIGLMEELQAVR